MASTRSRLSSLLCLLLFITGGPGVPGLDAILFHLHQSDTPRGTHVETAGANCHAERCLVGVALYGPRIMPRNPMGLRVASPATVVRLQVPVVPAAASRFLPSPLPRSPPLAS